MVILNMQLIFYECAACVRRFLHFTEQEQRKRKDLRTHKLQKHRSRANA